jgi:hypothetical protein
VSTHEPSQRFWPEGQLVAHAGVPSVRHPNVQVVAAGCEHAPEPLHVPAGLAWLLVQVADAQLTVLPGNTQAVRLVPLHVPTHEPVPAHGVRGVVTATHVPRLLVVEHDSHWPLHAALQQTPSAHTPLAQTLPALQASPSGLPTHVPLLHTGVFPLQPPQQSLIGMQLPLQSFIVPEQLGVVPPAPPPPVPPRPAAPAPPLVPAPPDPLPAAPPRPLAPAPPLMPAPPEPEVAPPMPALPPPRPPVLVLPATPLPALPPVPAWLPAMPPSPDEPASTTVPPVPAGAPPAPAPPPPRPGEPAASAVAPSRAPPLPPPPSVGLNGVGEPQAASAQATRDTKVISE